LPDAEAPSTAAQPSEGPLKPSGAAHGIQLQMSAGDGRVEIRVTDRAGEVRVDVRTPDSRLAGALRADLPELAARIEQTGYRAETWQPPSSSSPDRWRIAESGAASPSTESQSQRQGGQRQDEGQRQNSRDQEQTAEHKPDRKDFQWLFNSIR
jgi:flagellar hook-length control protein FliK